MSGSRRSHIAVGFDGGGTKTECVVLNAEGKVLGRGMAGPSNPLRVGIEAAFTELAQAATEALAAARLKPRQIEAVCAGLAGAGRRSVVRSAIVFLSHEFPDALTHVTTDCEVALEAAVGSETGVVIIAGTGSAAFGRNEAGETARAGGFGRWIGDDGSAYEIGRRAVGVVSRSRDQAAPLTVLTDILLATLDCTWDELIERITKNPDDVFPRLFPAVVSAAGMEDHAAREILYAAALDLSSTALTVARRLGMQDSAFPLVKCGGVFGPSPLMDEMFDAVVASSAPQAKLSRLEESAAVGAARLAARLASGEDLTATRGANR
ncbi:MAG TPA: BadF/BadG/BcrA/BcrD ATPase family protein [Candidatus Acidoferrales bacterium]|jgi:N-acetylglucosamine kinase